MNKYFKILVLLVLLCTPSFAQELSFDVSVDKNVVSVNDKIVLSISISSVGRKLPQLQLPDIKGFSVYSSGTSKETSIINGEVSNSVTYTYVLVPDGLGKYTIPSLLLNYKNKKYSSKPITINVVKRNTRVSSNVQSNGYTKKQDLFIVTSVDKKRVYVNEPVKLTMKFYRRVALIGPVDYSEPSAVGFFSQKLDQPQKEYMKIFDGIRYRVVETNTMLFPTSEGKFTIGKAFLKCNVQTTSRSRGDFFASFFSTGKPVTLESKPINVMVMSFPVVGRPRSFLGDVGVFSLDVNLNKNDLELGEAVNLNIKITGEGNIKSINEPKLGNMMQYKKYDTVTSLDISNKGRVYGTKTFKVVLVPKNSGKLKVPGVEFSYFDFKKKKYITLKSEPMIINVKHFLKKSGAIDNFSDFETTINEDIRFIKTDTSFEFGLMYLYKKLWVKIVLIFFPLLYLIIKLFNFYRLQSDKDVYKTRNRKALNKAIKKLDKFLIAKNISLQILFKILNDYLADKFNIKAKTLNLKMLEANFIGKEDIYKQIKDLWEELDFIRFSSVSISTQDIKDLAYKLKESIKLWDEAL